MADAYLGSHEAIENEQSFYNVIRRTGWSETPFFSSIRSVGFDGKDPALGHSWFYRKRPSGSADNAYAEGSKRADVKNYAATKLQNELQIMKQTYGVTGSQKDVMSVEKKRNYLSVQSEFSAVDLSLSVEKALILNGAPVASATDADVRKMGGISHYLIHDIDVADAALDWKLHVKEMLKMMWKNGCRANYIMAGPDQKDALDEILDLKKQYGGNETGIISNASIIKDASYAKNVKVVANPLLSDDTILFYDSTLLAIVLHRQIKGRNCTDPNFDAEAYEHLFELTYQMEDPYAMVRLTGLKTA